MIKSEYSVIQWSRCCPGGGVNEHKRVGDEDLNEDCLPEADAYDCNSDGDDAGGLDEFE